MATVDEQLRYSLRFLSGKSQGSEYVLADTMEVVVGRSGEVDLILVEGMVSRRHARFLMRESELTVEDLGSTNGTFVNGVKIGERRLIEGDRVLIGTTILKVKFTQAPLGTRPPPPPAKKSQEDVTANRYRVSGDLEEVSVPELLEMFSGSGREAVIELESVHGTASVTVGGGCVQECRLDTLPDAPAAKAVLRVMGWGRGEFTVKPYAKPEEARLDVPVKELLVDGLFKLDELEVLRQRLPDPGATLLLAKPMQAPLSALDEADLDMLQSAHNVGEIDTVIDASHETDLEAAKRLLALFDGGYLRRA
jgi:hypothetical protein